MNVSGHRAASSEQTLTVNAGQKLWSLWVPATRNGVLLQGLNIRSGHHMLGLRKQRLAFWPFTTVKVNGLLGDMNVFSFLPYWRIGPSVNLCKQSIHVALARLPTLHDEQMRSCRLIIALITPSGNHVPLSVARSKIDLERLACLMPRGAILSYAILNPSRYCVFRQ